MEKEYMLEYGGKLEKFKFRPLTFGEKNKLVEEFTDIKIVAGQQLVKVSPSRMIEGAILRCLILAPFPVTLQNIQDVPIELGAKLTEIVTDLNNLDEKKNQQAKAGVQPEAGGTG